MALHVAIAKAETQPVEVLRPTLNWQLARSASGGSLLALVLAAQLVASFEAGSLLGALLGCAAVALAVLVGTASYLWWVRIELDSDASRFRLLRGTRRVAHDEVWGVALRDVVIASTNRPVAILYSRDHRCLAIIDRRLWSKGAIEALASWAGCSVPAASPTTTKRLESEFAGATSAWQRHGWLVGTGFVFALVVLVVLIHSA